MDFIQTQFFHMSARKLSTNAPEEFSASLWVFFFKLASKDKGI